MPLTTIYEEKRKELAEKLNKLKELLTFQNLKDSNYNKDFALEEKEKLIKHHEESLGMYRKKIDKNVSIDVVNTLFDKGVAFYQKKEYKKAIEHYEESPVIGGHIMSFNIKKYEEHKGKLGYQLLDRTGGENGANPKPMSDVTMHYDLYLLDGKKIDSSRDKGKPFKFTIGAGQVIKAWDEGVAEMKVGEKAVIVAGYDYAYGEKGYPGVIPEKATLVFDVELIKFDFFDVSKYKSHDGQKGYKLLDRIGGSGGNPKSQTEVTMHYDLYLLDGTKVDSSRDKGRPFKFKIGAGQVIKAWDEGVAEMKKGEKAVLVAGYDKAYGEQGYPGVIPPKATLVFDVELIDF